MVRRGDPDPLLLQTVSERLARLLAEEEPRRAVDAVQEEEAAAAASGRSETAEQVEPVDEVLPARRFGRAHLGVVVALLLVGVLVAGWSLLRARPVALAEAEPTPVVLTEQAAPSAGAPLTPRPPDPTPSQGRGLVVHVLGAVKHPGLVRLPADARVQDAVDAAGGFTRAADPGELNLAQLLTDGQQVLIGSRSRPDGKVRGGGVSSGGGPGPPAAGGSGPAVVDLNQADVTQLEELPGVGPVTATKIVAWRDEHGRFTRVEELQEVSGIGPKTYVEIAPHVRV